MKPLPRSELLEAIIAVGLIVYGTSMLSIPVAIIVAGVLLLLGIVWRIG